MNFTDYLLYEELTPEQKKKVDKMPRMVSNIAALHKKVFGDSDKIIIPYEKDPNDKHITSHSNEGYNYDSHTAHVLGALKSAGYHTDDYESGLAYHKDTPDRKMKIGKILQKEGLADRETHKITARGNRRLTVGQLYAADPLRASTDKNEKQIVISKHPHDVAGMSTGRSGWNSCMNIDNGQNRHYLPKDIQHGTITAYVTKKGDDNINAPIGRINLKRFDSGHSTIFRPEGRGYGSVPHGAIKKIGEWAEKNYPSRPGLYAKHGELYNDDGNQIKMEKPEEMNQDHAESLRTLHHMISDMHSTNEEREYADIQKFGHNQDESARTVTDRAVHEIMAKMHPDFQLHTIAHQIADRTGDNNTHESIWDNYEPNSHEFTQQWARDTIENEGVDKHSRIGKMIKNLTPEKALSYHKVLHDAGIHAQSIDEHPEHLKLHGEIIDHIMNNSPAEHKDHVLNDITEEKHDYYHPMFSEYHSGFDTVHPLEHTENPRMHHTMLSRDMSQFDYNPPDEGTWEHIGKHADSKLAHELIQGDLAHHLQDEDHQYAFHKGLSNNPNGEHIQHEILKNINFHGGESPLQSASNHEFKDINGNRIWGVKNKGVEFQDPASDEHLHSHFLDIAHTTKHKSVQDVMKTREDFKHDEAVQDALKGNR